MAESGSSHFECCTVQPIRGEKLDGGKPVPYIRWLPPLYVGGDTIGVRISGNNKRALLPIATRYWTPYF